MSALETDEIMPGLNVFLDVDVLAACDGVESNARSGAQVDSQKLRPFLVVKMLDDGRCLCVPLFSEAAEGRIKLNGAKTGPGYGWQERESFFSRFQFWKIPPDCLVKASHRERNGVGRRQRYAENDQTELASIASHICDSDVGYSPISN